MQTKYNSDRTVKCEYHVCVCGCGYKITVTYNVPEDSVMVKDTVLPAAHVGDEKDISPSSSGGRNIHSSSEVHEMIDYLADWNKFVVNFGAVNVIKHLRDCGFEESVIPSSRQINNRLAYYKKKGQKLNNIIDDLECYLSQHLCIRDEESWQPFLYLYDVDDDGR